MIWEFFDTRKWQRDDDRNGSKRSSNRSSSTTKSEKRDRPAVRSTEIDDRAQAYLLHEYDAHSRWLAALVQKRSRELTLGILATAGYWAWYFIEEIQFGSFGTLLAWLPTAFVVFFLLKSFAYQYEFTRLLKYMKDVEKKFKLPGRLGFFTQRKKYGRDVPRSLTQVMWLLLLFVNVGAAIFRDNFVNGSG